MKKNIISKAQFDKLNGLYFHLFIKKYKATEKDDLKELEKTIDFDFKECDKHNISFKIQNIVVAMVEDYESHYKKYFIDRLKEKNIIVSN